MYLSCWFKDQTFDLLAKLGTHYKILENTLALHTIRVLISNPRFLQSSPSQGTSQSAGVAWQWPDWWHSGSEAPWRRWWTHCRWPKEAHCWGDPNYWYHSNGWWHSFGCRTWWFHRNGQKSQDWYLIRSVILNMSLLICTTFIFSH